MRVILATAACALTMLALVCLQANLATAQTAKEPYVIGAVLDITGPGSPLGTPERDTLQMLEKQINAKGGINGHPLKVIIYDNASDEAKSVTAVKKLIEDDNVLAIIGPSQTGTTLAAADTVQAAKVPMISCAAGIKIVEPVKPWIFKTAQSDMQAVAKVIDYCKAHRLNKIAIISVSNAFGDSGRQLLEERAPAAKIQIVAKETFGQNDTDMTAQILRLRGKRPDAVICWGTNPGPAIVAKNMQKLGMKTPLIMSHGVANRKFLELAGDSAEGVILPAGKLVVAGSIANNDPQKKVLQQYAADFKKEYGREADTFGGFAYDALHLIVRALEKVGPNRAKIREELENMKFTGISGAFRFTQADHNGLAKDSFVMVQIRKGNWVLAK